MNARFVARRDFLMTASLSTAAAAGLVDTPVRAAEPGQAPVAAPGYTLAEVRKFRKAFDLKTCWDGGDLSRYVYLHMPEFFPHATIHRAGPISRLEAAPDPGVEKVEARVREEEVSLDQYLRMAPVDGFIVVHRGMVVFERYPQLREFDKHIFWSVSKVFAATLVARLEDEGRVDVRKPVESYVPELNASDWKGTPLLDVLDMASGMTGLEQDDPTAYTDPESPYGLFEGSLGTMPKTSRTLASTYDYIATLKRQKPSGKAFEYTSVNTFVLSWIVENVTGKPYAETVSERIWRKIGAESDAALLVSPTGAPASHGCISGTLRDLARFGLLFTPRWKTVSRERIVSAAYLEKIQKGGRPAIYDRAGAGKGWIECLGERPRHNTYQWDVVLPDGDFFKSGYGGQGLYLSPSGELVIGFFSSGPDKRLGSPFLFARAIARSDLFSK